MRWSLIYGFLIRWDFYRDYSNEMGICYENQKRELAISLIHRVKQYLSLDSEYVKQVAFQRWISNCPCATGVTGSRYRKIGTFRGSCSGPYATKSSLWDHPGTRAVV